MAGNSADALLGLVWERPSDNRSVWDDYDWDDPWWCTVALTPMEQRIEFPNPYGAVPVIGPLLAYTFKDRPKKRFMRPTLYLLAQWWVKHRYRTGQEINQGLPLIVLGFSFNGELLKKD